LMLRSIRCLASCLPVTKLSVCFIAFSLRRLHEINTVCTGQVVLSSRSSSACLSLPLATSLDRVPRRGAPSCGLRAWREHGVYRAFTTGRPPQSCTAGTCLHRRDIDETATNGTCGQGRPQLNSMGLCLGVQEAGCNTPSVLILDPQRGCSQ
jgi:hypothetical protein